MTGSGERSAAREGSVLGGEEGRVEWGEGGEPPEEDETNAAEPPRGERRIGTRGLDEERADKGRGGDGFKPCAEEEGVREGDVTGRRGVVENRKTHECGILQSYNGKM